MLGSIIATFELGVWISKKLYYLGYYMLYGYPESESDAIKKQLAEVEARVNEIADLERQKQYAFRLETLRRMHEERERAIADGRMRSTDPMSMTCPDLRSGVVTHQ